ncbi:MAG: hypothetical protein ACK4WA_09405 [Chitinophagales bacterium]|nr:hypothetical protein [Sphingobacteriales bacterium]
MPWSFMRVIRLLMGVFLIAQGVYAHQWMAVFLGLGFSLLPILNLGCGCEGSSCTINKMKDGK